jgi:hypothetical protein
VFLEFYKEPLVLALFKKELEWFEFHTKMEPWIWFWLLKSNPIPVLGTKPYTPP